MAHEITELTRSVAPSADYPWGDLKDNPNGTLANRMMFTDLLQTMQRAMAQAGITPNGLDDNTTNTYQLAQALGLEAWTDLGTTLIAPDTDTGSVTVQSGDIIYNRYRLVGRTFQWKIQLQTVTVSGSPNQIIFTLPAAITAMGLTFANDLEVETNSFDQQGVACRTTLNVSGGSGTNKVILSRLDGTAFQNGTDDQWYHINIQTELT